MTSKAEKSPSQPVVCCRCNSTVFIGRIGTVGDMMWLSGYECVMTNDTSTLWFCPKCVAYLRPHIKAIAEAVGDHSIYWLHFLAFLKDKPSPASEKSGGKST